MLPADTYKKSDVLSVEESIVNHVEYTLARSRYSFDDQEAYQAASLSLRDRLIESWNDTQQYFKCATFWGIFHTAQMSVMPATCNLTPVWQRPQVKAEKIGAASLWHVISNDPLCLFLTVGSGHIEEVGRSHD